MATALTFVIGEVNNRANRITNPDKSRQSSAYPLADDTKVGGVSSRSPVSVEPRD